MLVVDNRFIPFRGFKAINIFGIVFHRKSALPMTEVNLNHEEIHTWQMEELLFVGFYLWYIVEWLIRLAIYRDARKAYRTMWFEQEAYEHQDDMNYLAYRRNFAGLR